jgi:hypothetical protein
MKKLDYLSTLFVGIDIGARQNVVSTINFEQEFLIKMKPVPNTQFGADQFETMLVNAFPNNDAIAKYAGIVWKENQSGGFKAENTPMNKAGGQNGLFICYVTRSDNSFHIEPSYDSQTNMTWYNETKKIKHTFITEPTVYKVNGKDVAMASLIVPILDENKNFMGVISIDYKLETFQKIVEKIKPMGGFVQLSSKHGIYVANGADDKLIMTDAKKRSQDWENG